MIHQLVEVGSCLSRLLNVCTGHGADLTYSARAYRDRLWSEPLIDGLFLFLTGEADHCRRWWEEELRRSRRNLEIDAIQASGIHDYNPMIPAKFQK